MEPIFSTVGNTCPSKTYSWAVATKLGHQGMKTDVRDELVALLPRLRRFAFSQTRSIQDADDLVQAAYERALTRIDQFQPGSRLDNWMFTIVRNIWIDSLRAKARRPEVTNTDLAESLPYQDRITERAEARSDLHTLSKVMMELSTDQLSVLTLVVINGYTYGEAAEILQVPKGTVMSRLFRARARLAASLDVPIPATILKTKDVGNDSAN